MRTSLLFLSLGLTAVCRSAATLTIANTVQTIGPGDRILVYGTVDNSTGTMPLSSVQVDPTVVSGLATSALPVPDRTYPGAYSSYYGLGGVYLPVGSVFNGLLLAFKPYTPNSGEEGVLSLRALLYAWPFGGGLLVEQPDVARVNVVAQPVPEPSAFAALGLGVVVVLRRRRK